MSARAPERGERHPEPQAEAEKALTLIGRLGLAGRTGFYAILTALTIRIAVLGGDGGGQANAHGALTLISRSPLGKVAIGAVALGFVLFGVGRLAGAVTDRSVSAARRAMTVAQGVFYVALAYIPASFLAGNQQTGSQQQQEKTTAAVLNFPGGQELLVVVGLIMLAVCVNQIRTAVRKDFRDGLDLRKAPGFVRAWAGTAGTVGITARALVFLPIGVFLIVSTIEHDAGKSYGTDAELLRLSGHPWGIAVLALVAAGLAVFVVFSGVETCYRTVVSAR